MQKTSVCPPGTLTGTGARRPLRCVTLTRMALNNAASVLDQLLPLIGAQPVEIKRVAVKVEPAIGGGPSKVRVLLWVATSSDAVALRTAPWATALSAQLPVTRGYLSAEISSDADYALALSPTTSTGILASLEPLFQPEVHANPSYVTPDDPTAFTVSESARC